MDARAPAVSGRLPRSCLRCTVLPGELVDRHEMSPARIRRARRRLKAAGLITRQRDCEDRRVRCAQVPAAGLELISRVAAA